MAQQRALFLKSPYYKKENKKQKYKLDFQHNQRDLCNPKAQYMKKGCQAQWR